MNEYNYYLWNSTTNIMNTHPEVSYYYDFGVNICECSYNQLIQCNLPTACECLDCPNLFNDTRMTSGLKCAIKDLERVLR